jgi:putative transposase
MDSENAKENFSGKSSDSVRADVTVRAPTRDVSSAISKRDYVNRLVEAKRHWHQPLTDDEKEKGFKGWNTRGYLPHFDAPGVRQFITFRLADSIPPKLKHEWLQILSMEDEREKFRRVEQALDRGEGACCLRNHQVAKLVEENLLFHHGHSYRLLAWVIMPNHVHVLADMFKPLGTVVKSWKAYTARYANEILGAHGRSFWQRDYFDRYIRDNDQFRRVIHYIEANPVKARLVRESREWSWSSAKFRGRFGSDEPLNIPDAKGTLADVTVRAPIQ